MTPSLPTSRSRQVKILPFPRGFHCNPEYLGLIPSMQPSLTPVPGYLMSSSGHHRHCMTLVHIHTCMQSILTNKRNKILNRTKFKSLCYHGILMTGLMEGSTPTSTSFNLMVVHSHQPFFHRKNLSLCLFGQNLDGKLAFSPHPSWLVVVVGYWGAWFLCTSVSLTRILYHQIMHPTCLSGSLYQLILKNQGGPQ